MNRKIKILIAISSILLIVIIAFITIKGEVFRTKQEILVKVFPANIMDLLNNEEYIDLQYNISSISSQDVHISDDNFIIGNDIYICVKTGEDGYAIATNVCLSPLENKLCIKGELTSINNNTFGVDYNIDKYFIPKGTDFSKSIDAKIIIDELGNAEIKSLVIDGKEI